MKNLISFITASLLSFTLISQNEVELRPDGIVVPRTDTSSVANPTEGMMIYDTTLNNYTYYDGIQWQVQGDIEQVDTEPCDPTVAGYITDDGNLELDGASSVFVQGDYAYVTSNGDDGVEILDISDPVNPTHVGSITDDGTTALDGARSIVVRGKYAYVASDIDDGVEILDISDPSNPTHVGSITDHGSIELNGAKSIFVSGNYAYVASFSGAVEIIDISDPSNPTHVGSITDDTTTALHGAHSIFVRGKYAYVASFFDDGVEILDISDPTNPTHVGSITDDAITELDGALSIYVSGNYAYVASSEDDGVEILDISDPANPTHVGSITDDATTALGGAYSIVVNGKYAYIASQFNSGFEILDISDPVNPEPIGTLVNSDQFHGAHDIFISGNYAYVVASSRDAFGILDICGSDIHAANIGNIKTSQLDVEHHAIIGSNLTVGEGMHVGDQGIFSSGPLAINQAPVAINFNSGGISHIDLHEEATGDFARLDFSNTSGDEKWTIAGRARAAGSQASAGLNFFYSDVTGNVLQLFGDGDAHLDGELSVQSLDERSDRRLKKNIIPLTHVTDQISDISGYRYSWKDDKDSEVQIGFIAQEIQDVFPELVNESEEGTLSVRYTKMVPILLQAIKEQQTNINNLENQLNTITTRLDQLENHKK